MVAKIFDAVLSTSKTRSVSAVNWYNAEALRLKNAVNTKKIFTNNKNIRTGLSLRNIGQMFMFFYDPKHKNNLPYYDRFPLVFPVEMYSDGFLGINLHYLPTKLRVDLMNALYSTLNNNKNNETTRLRISYEILRSASRMRYFKPCLKRYLNGHVSQKFVYIEPSDWDKAILLPTERFMKKPAAFVQAESVRSLRGN